MGIDAGVLATLSLVSSGVSALGGLAQGMATAQADNYNAEIAAQNRTIALNNARMTAEAGEAQAEQSSLKTRATVGAILANQAAGNIDVNSGSAPDVRSSAEELGETDALTIRSNATREAYGEQVQATGFANQEQLDKFAGQNAEMSGFTTFLGGIGSGTSKWLQFQRQGLLTPPGSGGSGYSGTGAPISGGNATSGYGGVM